MGESRKSRQVGGGGGGLLTTGTLVINLLHRVTHTNSCADSESFIRGGPTLTTFFLFSFLVNKGGSKYNYKRAIIGPPAKRRLNGVSLTCR